MRARLGAAALAGVAGAFAFPPAGLWPLAIVAVAALSLTVRGMGPRAAAGIGFAFGVGYFLVLLRWLHVIGPDAVLILGLLQAAFYAPLGAVLAASYRFRAWPLLQVSAWVLVEATRARFPLGGFPWGKLAHAVVDTPLAALASLGGTPLVTAAVAGLGVTLAAVAPALRAREVRPVALAAAGMAVLFGSAGLIPLPTGGDTTVPAAVVQGNVPRLGLDIGAQRDQVLANHLQATRDLAAAVRAGTVPAPQLVIWPENASDDDPFADPALAARISAVVDEVGVDTLIGTVLDVPSSGDGPDRVTNTGIVWSPGEGATARYSKRQLVPFGEYIPARDFFTKFIGRLALIPRDFLAGTEPGVLQIGGVTVGAVICYEVAYDNLVRDVVRGGGRLLVVQTNNATYGRTGQPEQQLAISRLRSIEHGRAMLIAATSGISAVIAPDGRVIERTAEFTQDVLVAQVPLRDATTLATRLGAWPELAVSVPALVLIVTCVLARIRRRRSAEPVTVAAP